MAGSESAGPQAAAWQVTAQWGQPFTCLNRSLAFFKALAQLLIAPKYWITSLAGRWEQVAL